MIKDWYTECKIDDYTTKLENLAISMTKAANENNKDYFFGGGLAIDFSVGKITRNHHDIDFHPMLGDINWWEKWFTTKGYKLKSPADKRFSETYKVLDEGGNEIVDMWPFKLQGDKLMIMIHGKYADSGRH